MLLEFALIVVGFALLIGGADALVDGASNIAKRFGMPDRVVGLTIVAVGTGMPELVVSITSAAGGHADMAFGNVVGSCLANLLLILGLSAAIKPLKLSRRTQRLEIPMSVGAALILLLFAKLGNSLNVVEGVILTALFAAFMVSTMRMGLREGESGEEDIDPDSPEALDVEGEALARRVQSLARDAVLLVGGIILLKFGADLVVDNSSIVAASLGLSERVIGITVVALGTCLPELVTSMVATAKGNVDLAVGNIIGSNITNLLLVMGVPAIFTNIPYSAALDFDFILLVIFSGALIVVSHYGTRNTFSRRSGIAYTFLYVVYVVASMMR